MPSVGPKEHQRFCELDGWELLQSARGKNRDHFYFKKRLPDGRVARTKVSYSNKEYGPGLWHRILRDQLLLENEEQFWRVLNTQKPAPRPGMQAPPEGKARIPGWLFDRLVYTVGLPSAKVAAMTVEEAESRWRDYQMTGQ